jgi:hypothetical protein
MYHFFTATLLFIHRFCHHAHSQHGGEASWKHGRIQLYKNYRYVHNVVHAHTLNQLQTNFLAKEEQPKPHYGSIYHDTMGPPPPAIYYCVECYEPSPRDPFWYCRCTLKADPIYGTAAIIRTKRLRCMCGQPRRLLAFLCLKRITSEGAGHLQHSGETDSEGEDKDEREE